MLRSLFAGISGLRVNQTALDVTGNNIANANTTGFKSSSTVFQDTLSQMLTASSGENAERGGTNPIQVGLGVQLAATTLNFTQGGTQTTGRATDLSIQGDGFFVVNNGQTDLYTRAGAFTFDESGTLVTPDGMRVMGYLGTVDPATGASTVTPGGPLQPIDINAIQAAVTAWGATQTPPVNPELVSYNIGPDGKVMGIFDDNVQREIAQLAIADFTNPMGLEKVGDTNFRVSANSGDPEFGVAGQGGRGDLAAGTLEMSNVDLSQEFTNLILAQRGFQASARVITTSDQVLEELVNIKR